MNKYRNKKTEIILNNEIYKFDSKKEAQHFQHLLSLLRAGVISELKLQPEFEIIPQVKWNGKTLSKIKYIADFQYKQAGLDIVVDVKGIKTDVYNLKKRLFLLQYGDKYKFLEI